MSTQPRRGWLALLTGGFVLGILAAAGFGYGMHATGTDEFCNTCHASDAAKEWRESVHYRNRSGFVAGCTDCHLPGDLVPRMLRKARGGTIEVWGHLRGVISTPEKYEARRREMAENEWRRMRGNGAQECRNCHHADSMADPRKGAMHAAALAAAQICIDCHKGVAHRAPGESAK